MTTPGTGTAEKVDRSNALDHGVRLGLVVYGVVHLVIAATAVDLLLDGGSGSSASQQGAFAQLAESPLGVGVLWFVACGFAALVVWQLVEAAVGHRDSDGTSRVVKRLASLGKAVVYTVLGFSAGKMAAGSGQSSGKSGTDAMTARLMSAPAGQVLVGLVGLGVVAVGCFLAYRGWAEKFTKRLDGRATSGEKRTPVLWLGKVGHIGKGLSLGAVGVLFLVAAVQHDPQKSGGLDVALHDLLRQPFGGLVVGAVALGLACYGLFCLAWARYLDR
jgi:hypothetical protein